MFQKTPSPICAALVISMLFPFTAYSQDPHMSPSGPSYGGMEVSAYSMPEQYDDETSETTNHTTDFLSHTGVTPSEGDGKKDDTKKGNPAGDGKTDEEKEREKDQKDAADLTDPPLTNRGCTGNDPGNRTCYSNAGRIKTTTTTTFEGNFLNYTKVEVTTTSHWDPTDGGSYEFFEKRTVTTERVHIKLDHGFSDSITVTTEGIDANGNETKRTEQDLIEQYDEYKMVEFMKEFIRDGKRVWLPVKMRRKVESVNIQRKWVDAELVSVEGTRHRIRFDKFGTTEVFIRYTPNIDGTGFQTHTRTRSKYYGLNPEDASCLEIINGRTAYSGSCPWYSYRDNN